TEAANFGSSYRSTGVDLQPTTDVGGGYNVGWTSAGEWLKYSVNINSAGLYTLSVRVASVAAGGTFHIEFDDVDKTGPWILPNTGGWQTWQTLNLSNVVLDAGQHVMKLVFDSNDAASTVGNYNYIQATRTLSNNPPSVSLSAPPDSAIFSSPASITVSALAGDV